MTAKRFLTALLLGSLLAANTQAATKSFNVGISLITPIKMTLQSPLNFPSTTAGNSATVTTDPADTGSVHFVATGEPNAAITGTILENQVTLTTSDGLGSEKQITVDNFVTGGDMNESGLATFDENGALDNLRIGATAHIDADNIPGSYSTTATYRVVYN